MGCSKVPNERCNFYKLIQILLVIPCLFTQYGKILMDGYKCDMAPILRYFLYCGRTNGIKNYHLVDMNNYDKKTKNKPIFFVN